MKKVAIFCLPAILTSLVGCSVVNALLKTATKSYTVTHATTVTPTGGTPVDVAKLTINWQVGDITVTRDAAATEISASGTITAYGSTQEEADSLVQQISVTLTSDATDPSRLILTTSGPLGLASNTWSVSTTVIIPVGLELTIGGEVGDVAVSGNTDSTTIRLEAGDVDVANNTGEVDISADAGNVEVSNAAGDVQIVSESGATTLSSCTGDIDVRADSGTVEVDGCVGNLEVDDESGAVEVTSHTGSVDVAADSGSVTIHSINGNVRVAADSGSVTVSAAPTTNGTIDITSRKGAVTLTVPTTFAASLDLATLAGTVNTNLTGFTLTDFVNGFNYVTATLNGGGGSIEIAVLSGSITFTGQ